MVDKDILKTKTFLYVEDDESTKEEVSYFLEKFVGKIYTASNGKEGLEFFKKYLPDVVITDIQMPIMNGLDMIQEIKKTDKYVPIVVTTAFNETEYLLDAINSGVNRYILKPINMKKMLEELSELLDENVHHVLWQSLDLKGYILDINQECLDFFGYTYNEVVGKNYLEFIDNESREKIRRMRRYTAYNNYRDSVKIRIKHKEGFKIEVLIYMKFVYSKSNVLEKIDVEFKNINTFSRSNNKLEKALHKERYIRGLIDIYAQIASAITKAKSLEEFLQNVSNAFVKKSEYEHTFIVLYEGADQLKIVAQSKHQKIDMVELLGESFHIKDTTYFSITEVVNLKKILIVDDVEKLPQFPLSATSIKAIVSLPLTLVDKKHCFGLLILHFNNTPVFTREELDLFKSISETVSFGIQAYRDKKEKENLIELLHYQATTDILTGCHNRFKGHEIGKKEIERSRRYKRSFSILYFDLDHFKDINDTLGHEQGDIVLQKSTKLAQTLIRTTDSIIRWGGEEFIIILPETSLQSATKIADKIRAAYENAKFIEKRVITASFGVVELRENENWNALVKRADDLMYKAKNSGRNRVINA